MLYRLQFQGSCVLSTRDNNGFVRFLIDGRVLISNYLVNNNDQRHLLAPELGSSVIEIDHRGGGMIYSGGGGADVGMACSKSDIVYLPQRDTHCRSRCTYARSRCITCAWWTTFNRTNSVQFRCESWIIASGHTLRSEGFLVKLSRSSF